MSTSPSMINKVQQIFDIKNDIKNSLINKGASISDNTPFNEYHIFISNITQNENTGCEDIEGKEYLVNVLLGKKPELNGVITKDSSLKEIANYFNMIGVINLNFKEAVPLTSKKLNDVVNIDLSKNIDDKIINIIDVPKTSSISEKIDLFFINIKQTTNIKI